MDYDRRVTEGRKLNTEDPRFNWSNPEKKYDEDLWAVHAHPDYPSEMETSETIFHFRESLEI